MSTSTTTRTMLKVEGVHKWMGDNHVLRGVDLQVRQGEIVCILGPSGSGKSTLLRCINHLDPVDGGIVEVGAAASPLLVSGTTGPFIEQQTSVYATADQAARYWSHAVGPGLLRCVVATVQTLTSKGVKVSITSQQKVPFSSTAGRAALYRVVARANAVTLHLDVIIVGNARAISAITLSSFEAALPLQVEQALTTIVAGRLVGRGVA